MKRPLLFLLLPLLTGALAFALCYYFATRPMRQMAGKPDDGMAWLAQEFQLTPAQAAHVRDLHDGYEPRCMEMCERISKSGERLEKLLQKSTTMTPELEAAMREASQTQADCHAATLAQAFAISTHMAPEQAVRYRAMIAERIMPGTFRHDTATHR